MHARFQYFFADFCTFMVDVALTFANFKQDVYGEYMVGKILFAGQ
jgi:hypothetical protein